MKKLLAPLLVISLLSSTAAVAQQSQSDNHAQSGKSDKQKRDKQDQAEKQQAKNQQHAAQQQAKTEQHAAQQQARTQQNVVQQQAKTQQRANQQAQQQAKTQQRTNQQAQQRANQQAGQQRANQQAAQAAKRWSRGDRLPDQYRQDRYAVNNWQYYGLKAPPRGYRWHRDDNNNFFLVVISTGIISSPVFWEDRNRRWDQSYQRTYNYDDDIYYRECRTGPDPAGVMAGALIGALLGNSISGHDRAGATIAGIIIGGAAGAALTSHMDCEDRSYAYRAYSSGFNEGRINHDYGWHNPRNRHHGRFRVIRYYYDPYGFRCAEFRQTLDYLARNDRYRNGRACLQPNGAWVIVR
ncbi:MAG: RcnB family protein [Croceibacterium sp.]